MYFTDTNGKLSYKPEYNEAFECADLYGNEIQGMKERAYFYRNSKKKSERKLARDLAKCVLWIDREIWSHYEGNNDR